MNSKEVGEIEVNEYVFQIPEIDKSTDMEGFKQYHLDTFGQQ